MNTKVAEIRVSGLPVQIVRKDIKNLHLGVYPPNGRVRVAAPQSVSDDAVRLAVIGKLGWIKKRQAQFAAQPRQTEREMVSGESHYFLGQRYRLRVIEHQAEAEVVLRNKSAMELYVRPDTSTEQRREILQRWYRQRLGVLVPPLLEEGQSVVGIRVHDWRIKKMKTKWGSCNRRARRIWLNLELAKKPLPCLEYVLVHEIVHLLERHHTDRFVELMNRFMPGWRLRRAELNRAPLSHENWVY